MKKILVIDDAEFILESTSTLLKFEGYEVLTAADGLSGVKAAKDNNPDLILCDISMPGFDGYEVLEELRNTPNSATTPFIFLTAYSEKSNMRAGMEKGADDYIVKPYTRDELIAAIDAQWQKFDNHERIIKQKVEEVGKNVTYALPHEFRTVLNEVIGSAKYLNTSAEDVSHEEITELSQDIISSAKRLLKITENFLVYVRIENFASDPQKRAMLRSYITEEPAAVIYDFASVIAERYGRLEDLKLEETVDMIAVEISTENFHKIFDELIDNAFRFSSKGTPIKLGCYFDDKGILTFSIQDFGRGMTADQVSSIAALAQFERTIYEQQGIGLGLVIAKKLVELHDGQFIVESEEGKGTHIILTLPHIKRED